jgi:hypothetical protein
MPIFCKEAPLASLFYFYCIGKVESGIINKQGGG